MPSALRRTIVYGHRGGNFGPDNSMKNFKGAIANNIDGIEFDVWLSKDSIPMVLHGGSNGKLSDYGRTDYVFQLTQQELQSLINLGGGERIPTLEALFQLCQTAPAMLLSLEMKAPSDEPWVSTYNKDVAAQKVVQLITMYNVGSRLMVSSFKPSMLTSVLLASSTSPRTFTVYSLLDKGATNFSTPLGMNGLHITYDDLT